MHSEDEQRRQTDDRKDDNGLQLTTVDQKDGKDDWEVERTAKTN